MTSRCTIVQKENNRYTFSQDCDGRCVIEREVLFENGDGSVTFRRVTKEEGNNLYLKMMALGYKRFRSIDEVSWYATAMNNTPYEEEWRIVGNYIVPIKSRVLQQ